MARGVIVAVVVFFVAATASSASAPTLKVVRTYQRYAGEEGLAVAFGSIWTSSAASGESVARTDIGSGKSRSIDAPIDQDTGLSVGLNAIWQTDFGDGVVRRIDPRTDRVTSHGGFAGPAGMAFAGRRVFVALHHGQAVAEIDPRTLRTIHTYRLPKAAQGAVASGPTDVAIAGSSLWVSVPNLGAAFRLTLAGGTIEARLPDCGGFVPAARRLWTLCAGRLAWIDVQTNRVHPTAVRGDVAAALGHAMWVASASAITKVAAANGAVESRQRFPGRSFQDLVAAQRRLWAFDANRVQVLELAPR
jgi:DNA-binding beta-propeller fold protein YncE